MARRTKSPAISIPCLTAAGALVALLSQSCGLSASGEVCETCGSVDASTDSTASRPDAPPLSRGDSGTHAHADTGAGSTSDAAPDRHRSQDGASPPTDSSATGDHAEIADTGLDTGRDSGHDAGHDAGSSGCWSASQCPQGQACQPAGSCGPTCNGGHPCNDACCVGGSCAPNTTNDACGSGCATCSGTTPICSAGACAGCTGSSECPPGTACQLDGSCSATCDVAQPCNGGCCVFPPVSLTGTCHLTGCGAGQSCNAGPQCCSTSCSSGQCAQSENRGPCCTPMDCTAGNTCMSGTCMTMPSGGGPH